MKAAIRQHALALGFDDCRFTTAAPPESAPQLQVWLESGKHGEMTWLARNAEKRMEPDRVLPEAKSVICLTASYHSRISHQSSAIGHPVKSPLRPISRLPRHSGRQTQDAHLVRERSRRREYPLLWYVDTGPVSNAISPNALASVSLENTPTSSAAGSATGFFSQRS